MYPILFNFGFIHIYSYGLMVATAFLVSTFLLSRYAVSLKLNKDFFWNLSFWVLLGGIIGGRLLYIFLNLRFFLENPAEIVMLWHGGLVWYGGFLGGLLSWIWYIKSKKASPLKTLDIIIPFVVLGHSIGRIGCFLNGCCYGMPAWWGMYFPVHSDYLIPAQLFSSLALLVIFVVLRWLQERPHRDGLVVVIYLLLSSLERFLEEFLRNDSPRNFYGWTVFQVISAAFFLSALILWYILLWFPKKTQAGA